MLLKSRAGDEGQCHDGGHEGGRCCHRQNTGKRRCGFCAPPVLAPHRACSARVVSCRPRFTTAATLCPSPTAAATALSPTVAAPLSCSPPLLTAAPRR